jgi:hypothetical protein
MGEFFTARTGPIVQNEARAKAALTGYWPSYGLNSAARLIAEGLSGALKKAGAAPPRGAFRLPWRKPFTEIERHEIQKDKYSATAEEMTAALEAAAKAAAFGGEFSIEVVGEGLFLALPLP